MCGFAIAESAGPNVGVSCRARCTFRCRQDTNFRRAHTFYGGPQALQRSDTTQFDNCRQTSTCAHTVSDSVAISSPPHSGQAQGISHVSNNLSPPLSATSATYVCNHVVCHPAPIRSSSCSSFSASDFLRHERPKQPDGQTWENKANGVMAPPQSGRRDSGQRALEPRCEAKCSGLGAS